MFIFYVAVITSNIPILYLNLNEYVKRKSFMEKQFVGKNVNLIRIQSINTKKIDENDYDVSIVENHSTQSGIGSYKDHFKNIYSKGEISLILTYKKALQYAVDNDLAEPYVILEDDIIFDKDISEVLMEINYAPASWQVLQFYVANNFVRQQFCNISEKFVRWFPEYYSTALTVVRNKQAAEEIINMDLTGPHILDFWLYYNFESYTHTGNWFSTYKFSIKLNSMVDIVEDKYKNCAKVQAKKTKPKNICMALVTTSTAILYKTFFKNTFFPENININVIARESDNYLFGIKVLKWIKVKNIFSKWVYFEKLIKLHQKSGSIFYFDYYLFSDDDLSFQGFPWNTLNEKLAVDEPVILGIPRESYFANSVNNIPNYEHNTGRDFFIHTNGDFWRNIENPKENRWSRYQNTRFKQDLSKKLHFVEQGSTFLKANFASWYFSQVSSVILKMKKLRSDWIIDIMWCPAAIEYSNQMCHMFQHPVWHYDQGSLTSFYGENSHKSKFIQTNGRKLIRFTNKNETFAKWIKLATRDIKQFSKLIDYEPNYGL